MLYSSLPNAAPGAAGSPASPNEIANDHHMYTPHVSAHLHPGPNAPPGQPHVQQYPDGVAMNKREKRRREMAERVSRLFQDTVNRKDSIYDGLNEAAIRTCEDLLPGPVFPTYDLSLTVGELPPSLPLTDPLVVDAHPTPFLFGLHRLSWQRSQYEASLYLYHIHRMNVVKNLYKAEVERIEEEFEASSKSAGERLIEGVEEKRRKLNEEKDGEGNASEVGEVQTRSQGRGRGRAKGGVRGTAGTNGAAKESAPPPTTWNYGTGGIMPLDGMNAPPSGDFSFGLGGFSALNSNGVSNGPSLRGSSSADPLLALLSAPATTRRKAHAGRPLLGVPSGNVTVVSGQYPLHQRCLQGMSALRTDEIEADLGELRRKRGRVGGGSRR